MAMSRAGVSHSWMVELHANVACILNHPATKQTATRSGIESVLAHIRLAAISTAPDTRSWVRVEKRNLIRSMTAKFIAIPTSDAYPAISISSCIRAVVPTMSEAAARYTPPENWTIRTKRMKSQGFSRRGMKP